MYIISIAWLYVTLLMALTETSVVAGVLSFVFYGLVPTALLWWLGGGRKRRKPSNGAVNNHPPGPSDRDQ